MYNREIIRGELFHFQQRRESAVQKMMKEYAEMNLAAEREILANVMSILKTE
jgi:hypothetical protein